MGDLRYGVVIAVPEPHASVLAAKRCEYGDAEGERVPTHITLVPPTPVDAGRLPAVRARVRQAAEGQPGFSVRLSGTDTFFPVTPVAFMVVAGGAEETARLARAVRVALATPEPDLPFHPHVTIAHHLDRSALDHACADLAGFEAEFPVAQIALFTHDGTAWLLDSVHPLSA
ncbi:MAG: 2'-5' RNA ligase family protein [Aeromicrobium sp.]|uniref:2'-5' RNA ligase family protein n=1 Tax=Aeromicrobium sp. TaxID=1871063 RepID=UPI0039E3DF28